MIVISIFGYFGIGFLFFLITLFINKVCKFNLFLIDWRGENIPCGTLGLFIVLAWPVLVPILAIAGIACFIFRVCDFLVKKYNTGEGYAKEGK
jgi:hypothetical protein